METSRSYLDSAFKYKNVYFGFRSPGNHFLIVKHDYVNIYQTGFSQTKESIKYKNLKKSLNIFGCNVSKAMT